MDNLKLIGLGIVLVIAGYGIGYFAAPDKIKIEEKIIEKEKTVKEENKKVTEEYDPNTGKVTKRIEETGKKETNTNSTQKDKTTEKEKTRKMWALKGGVALDPRKDMKLTPRVGGEVRLPIFNSWVGVEADINIDRPLVGAYLRLEF
jgi:hypothetical protein